MNRNMALAVAAFIGVLCSVNAKPTDREMRLNVVVSSTGHLRSDGKGTYYTGQDHVAAWINPSRWPEISFNICMNWPFAKWPGVDAAVAPAPSGTPDTRTLVHRMTDPVPDGGGKPLGVFTGPGGGNDVALPKPLTAIVRSLTDMAVGSSLSPQSAEVRFCNSDCSEVYSVVFGEKSVFGYPRIHGAGTTRPTVSRMSETAWTISFPPRAAGRVWHRMFDPEREIDLGLYYYEGILEIRKQ